MNQQSKPFRTILLIALLVLVLAVASSSLLAPSGSKLTYSDVLTLFSEQRVQSFVLQGDTLTLPLYGSGSETSTVTAKIGDIETFHKDLDQVSAVQSTSGVLQSYNYLPASTSSWKTITP